MAYVNAVCTQRVTILLVLVVNSVRFRILRSHPVLLLLAILVRSCHTFNSRDYMGVNGKALQLHIVDKNRIFYYKSCENPYQVLQVMRESVSGTTIHVCCV